jgi:threonine dehydratase
MDEVLEGIEENVHLVRVDDNPAGTFKDRGSDKVVMRLLDAGVCHVGLASAGNALRGGIQEVAPTGMKFTGVLPVTASDEKYYGSLKLWEECGGKPEDLVLIKYGQTYNESLDYLNITFPTLAKIHAFDDPDVIDGRKTLAYDIAHTLPTVSHTVSANGGGSLITGLTAGFYDLGMSVETLVAEAKGSDSLSRSIVTGSEVPMRASNPNRKYGGLCVDRMSRIALKQLVQLGLTRDRITQARESDVRKLAESYEPGNTDYIEPSSIVAVAGLINFVNQGRFTPSDTVAVIASGHNEHPHRLLTFPSERRMRVASAQVLR